MLHDRLGLLLGRQGRWSEAIGHFREVARLRPAAADAHHALGQALAANGQLNEAVQESREAVRLAPGRAELRGDLASVLYRAGSLRDAMAELREALRLGRGDAGAAKWHYNLAAMLAQTGDAAGARRHLTAALHIDPGYEPARRALELNQIA